MPFLKSASVNEPSPAFKGQSMHDRILASQNRLAALKHEEALLLAELSQMQGASPPSWLSTLPFARTWLVGLLTGLVWAAPVIYFKVSAPWLIAVPICLGGILAGVWELRSENSHEEKDC